MLVQFCYLRRHFDTDIVFHRCNWLRGLKMDWNLGQQQDNKTNSCSFNFMQELLNVQFEKIIGNCTPIWDGFCFGPWGQSILLAWTDPQFTFVWRPSKSEKSALSSLSPLYISANLLRNKRLWFVIGGFQSVLCIWKFKFPCLILKSTKVLP